MLEDISQENCKKKMIESVVFFTVRYCYNVKKNIVCLSSYLIMFFYTSVCFTMCLSYILVFQHSFISVYFRF